MELILSSYGDSVPSSPGQIISSLCSAIRDVTEGCTCVGTLISEKSKHQVWVPSPTPALQASDRVVSLATLLSEEKPPKKERLKLGVRLASSVLQFHNTQWLQERWGNQDIFLIQGDSSQSCPRLETPVVRQAFPRKPPVADVATAIVNGNLSLFSLGIVLMELWFWKNMDPARLTGPQVNEPPYPRHLELLDRERYREAQNEIPRLIEKAGHLYGGCVQRCLDGLDNTETQLGSKEFDREADLVVLQPLEKNLQCFCDQQLEEIFKKPG